MGKRSTASDPEILYKEAEDIKEHERDLQDAYNILFDAMFLKPVELSTLPLHNEETTVYN